MSTRKLYGFNTLDTLSTPTNSDVCTASTAFTRGSVLLIVLSVVPVCGPSVLVLLIFPVGTVFRTPLTRVLQYTQHPQYPVYRTPQCCQHRQDRKKGYRTPYIRIYCTTRQHHAPTRLPTVVLAIGGNEARPQYLQ